MGRILLYTTRGCPWSAIARDAISSWNVPFYEIDLYSHADAVDELQELTDRMQVPQVFINEQHLQVCLRTPVCVCACVFYCGLNAGQGLGCGVAV